MGNVLVENSYLKAIANAIRNKLGVTTKYKPSEMAGAINSIVGQATLGTKTITANGTYDAEDDSLDGYSDVTVNVVPTGTKQISITQNGITTEDVADYASAEISVSVSSGGGDTLDDFLAESITAFRITDTNISTVKTKLSNYGKNSTLFINRCNTASNNMFSSSKFTSVVFLPHGNAQGTGNNFLNGDTVLTICDLGEKVNALGGYAFGGCTQLKTLILRRSTVVSCANTTFSSTPAASGGSGMDIYIPKTLYDALGTGTSSDYKAASNWSTWDGYGTITWHAIEESQYENYYADGTPI